MAYILSLILLLLICGQSTAQESCVTQNGNPGICIVIDHCKVLFDLLLNRYRPPESTAYLRNSQCGQENRDPKVCCEVTPRCSTNEGSEGKCQHYTLCEGLKDVPGSALSRNEQCSDILGVVCCPSVRQDERFQVPADPGTECGLDTNSDRVLGGNATAIDQYPWLALISYTLNSGRKRFACGASLVDKRHVITAAHCVAGDILAVSTPTTIRLGEFDKSNDGPDCVPDGEGLDCNDGPLDVAIEKIVVHPEYDETRSSKNDIAIIRLANDVDYTDFIKPICLPENDIILDSGSTLTVAGWGATSEGSSSNVKMHVRIPYVRHEQCQESYKKVRFPPSLWNKQICAGGESGKDSCNGDSGGPLMLLTSRRYILVGVVSFGPKQCGLEGIPGVYTNVFQYRDWIRTTMKFNSQIK